MFDFRNLTRNTLEHNGIPFKKSCFIGHYDNEPSVNSRSDMIGGKKSSKKKDVSTTYDFEGIRLLITKTYDEKEEIELSFATVTNYNVLNRRRGDNIAETCVSILFSNNSEDGNPIISEHELPNSYAHVQSFKKPTETIAIDGETIMRAVICYLRSYSEERASSGGKRIKYVQLRDKSFVQIMGFSVKLADYYTLTKGTAYYDRLGFVPYDFEYEFVDVDGVLELEKNKRTIRKQTIKHNPWIFEHFPQYLTEFNRRKIDPSTTSVGDAFRFMFQNFPQSIVPHIEKLQKKLGLVPFSRRGWALLLRTGTKFSDECAKRQKMRLINRDGEP